MNFCICHLWPDALNWNGSGGNVTCLAKRMEWRHFAVEVEDVTVGMETDFDGFDLVFLGAGHVLDNAELLADAATKAPDLRAFVEDGGTVLAVCEGWELCGRSIALTAETVTDGMGLVDMATRYERDRLTGNMVFDYGDGHAVVFENHAGRVYLGEDVQPLGIVLRGAGNNGEDKLCGARYKNLFGCHGHGPLLPKNPELADDILRAALFRHYPAAALQPLDDTLEERARKSMEKRLL